MVSPMSHRPLWPAAAIALLTSFTVVQCSTARRGTATGSDGALLEKETEMTRKVQKTDKGWKDSLTAEQYRVLREAGTERPFTGKYNDHQEAGTYACGACGSRLFASETKYDHGTGWPSFTAPVDKGRLELREDRSHGMVRTEVRCAACGSHLGHVFNDGPPPTGEHYCINSVALDFLQPGQPEEMKKEGMETAVFAAGCFWGIEDKFSRMKGVMSTRVGYTGGHTKNPTYKKVCSDTTGHAESVEVVFDPKILGYEELLEAFFRFHDPTQINRQGPDVGTQYRSAVFYVSESQKEAALRTIEALNRSGQFDRPIATQVLSASEFYPAEDYHQKYYEKLRSGK
ncbi:MAG: msrA [Candidatus Aminicenantes bacterium]|nr:msrA [Candidatus Aminicenantes bacterium]